MEGMVEATVEVGRAVAKAVVATVVAVRVVAAMALGVSGWVAAAALDPVMAAAAMVEVAMGVGKAEEMVAAAKMEGEEEMAATRGIRRQRSMNKAHRAMRVRGPPKWRHNPRERPHMHIRWADQATSWSSPTECRRTTSRCPRLPRRSHRSNCRIEV